MKARELDQHGSRLVTHQKASEATALVGAQGMDVDLGRLLEHLTVWKQDRLEGLVVAGGGNVLLDDEIGPVGLEPFAALRTESIGRRASLVGRAESVAPVSGLVMSLAVRKPPFAS